MSIEDDHLTQCPDCNGHGCADCGGLGEILTNAARELARRWPWSLTPWDRDRLHRMVREWMAARKSADDMDADIGEWLDRDIEDAHAIAREATTS